MLPGVSWMKWALGEPRPGLGCWIGLASVPKPLAHHTFVCWSLVAAVCCWLMAKPCCAFCCGATVPHAAFMLDAAELAVRAVRRGGSAKLSVLRSKG